MSDPKAPPAYLGEPVLHALRAPPRVGFQAVFGVSAPTGYRRCQHGRVERFEACEACQAEWHRQMIRAHEQAAAGHRAALERLPHG